MMYRLVLNQRPSPTNCPSRSFLAFLPTGPADALPSSSIPAGKLSEAVESYYLQTYLEGREKGREKAEICFKGKAGQVTAHFLVSVLLSV